MDALPNADTRRGGKNPSSAGLTSCTSPEVQSYETKNSQTGVSSDCVSEGKKQWFVLRATYGRTEKAHDYLQAKNIETYLPMHYVIKEIDGKRKLVHEPLLPNIIFAYMTREKTYEFVKEPAITAKWLKYYTDKTKPIEPETGKNPPVIIPMTVSLLGEDVLSDDCLVVVTGGNDDKNQNQNQQFEKGDNNPHCNNCHCNNCDC